jgi:hypothetical protein
MDRNDASALADLQMHWDEAYVIGLDGDIWSARYRASADELRAHTCTELRELIRSDYAYRQKIDRATDDSDDDEEYDDDQDDDEDACVDAYEGEDEGEAERDKTAVAGSDHRQHPERIDFAAVRGEGMSL